MPGTPDTPPPREEQPTPADGFIREEDVRAAMVEESLAHDIPEVTEAHPDSPPPEEITGRASGTDEDLTTLFNNPGEDHIADGFNDDPEQDDATE